VPQVSDCATLGQQSSASNEQIRITYSVSGLEEFAGLTREQWADYLNSLSEEELATLENQVIISAEMNYDGFHFFITSLGEVQINGEEFVASGTYQWLPGSGLVLALTDQDNKQHILPLWQETSLAFMFTDADSGSKMVAFRNLDSGLWRDGILNPLGNYYATMDIDAIEMSLEGGSFTTGERWGLPLVIIIVAIGAIVIGAKCIKAGVWDPYDCTPGTIACECNGCTLC
jgi:hypothetical protein